MSTDRTADAADLRAYHQRTKHHLDRYAEGPASLDWAAQPDPFRAWRGTRWYALPHPLVPPAIPWGELGATRPPAPFDTTSLSAFLRLSVAITAWKAYDGARWALRAHPSSGNLHPTETWVIASWVEGLADGLYHYQCRDHTVEWRAGSLTASDQPGLWLGFSSISWREAWKYGERAFRYGQLDMGHVLAAVAYAAALFGWQARLVNLSPESLAHCLGTDRAEEYAGVEPEEAEVIVALQAGETGMGMPPLAWDEWSGIPSLLDSRPSYLWPVIAKAEKASRGGLPDALVAEARIRSAGVQVMSVPPETGPLAAQVLLQRRSAQAFDGTSVLPRQTFQRVLSAMLPSEASPLWRMWHIPPRVHPFLMVHRVEHLACGLYFLPRAEAGLTGLAQSLRPEFEWRIADPVLPLYRLVSARAENTARRLSCHQDMAATSAFSLMFVAEFGDDEAGPLSENPAAYRHLHWEAGMLGHGVTLEAEAAGWRGTGIGCFFDDAVHELLGLSDTRWQVIYHFAVGMPVEDPRLLTLPAYG